ncbi:DUF222 domain-containing protein [Gordonia iterans]|uniref:DUF222 domain-containing protein n=1 Tax=Gordonia iterans TaxID=1004901 RepID=UPI00131B0EF1|nr:DUF222 domain-containing protein [Gordonia iterans]
MTVNGISYDDDAARSAPSTARLDTAGFDPDTLIAGLSPAELLAVQTATEKRLSAEATALLAAESDDGLLGLLDAREQAHRRAEVFDAALYVEISTSSIHRISDRGVYRRAGHISTHQLYAHGARLGVGEARRRRVTAEGIGAMGALTGERLEPRLAATATAVADGDAGGAHVAAVTEIMEKLPSAVTHDQRVKAEAMLADAARRLDPAAVTVVGNRILAWLDPDGTLADDHDRARRRTFNLQPQNRQLMSKVRALLTPVLRAKLEVLLYQWATTGMNNPGDPDSPRGAADQPGLDPAVLAAAAERETRTLGQRQHDALEALCDWALALAGQPAPTRIPSQVVVTVTDEDLARQAGIGWTATGTRIPVSDLVQFAADTIPYLAVFSQATGRRSPEHAWRSLRRHAVEGSCTWGAPTGSPPQHNSWHCSPATGDAPPRAAPSRSSAPKPTTLRPRVVASSATHAQAHACPTGPTTARPTLRLRSGQVSTGWVGRAAGTTE